MLGRLLLAGRLCVAALWEAACLRVGKDQALAICWLPTPSSPWRTERSAICSNG